MRNKPMRLILVFVAGMIVGLIPTIIVTIACILKIEEDKSWRSDK